MRQHGEGKHDHRSIVFTVQSKASMLCTSKPFIWEAVMVGAGGGEGWGGGFRGQEIRIRVINNFCSVMKPRERDRGGLSA